MANGLTTDLDHDLGLATAVSRRRITVNAVANYGHMAISVIVSFFLQAYIIRTLGREEYALWPMVGVCTAVLGLIPAGIGSGAGRFLAHALAGKRLKEVQQITASLFVSMCAAAVVYAGGAVVLSVFFERLFDIPPGAAGVGPWAMLLLGLAGAVTMPFSVFNGGLVATQRYIALNVVNTVMLLARVALVLTAFLIGYESLIALAAIHLGLALLRGITKYVLARRLVPWQRLRLTAFNWTVLRRVTAFSGLTLVISVAGLLYWKTDNVVINKLLDPALLTGYSVVLSFGLGAYRLVSTGCGVLMPAMTTLHAQGDTARIARLIYRANRIIVPLAAPALLFTIIFGRELLTAYVGPQYASHARLFPILSGAFILSCTQTSSGSVPKAFGHLGAVTVASFVWALLNVALSLVFVLILHWELIGVAAGTGIAILIAKAGWWPWYTARLLGLRWSTHFLHCILLPLAHCIPAALTMVVLHATSTADGWKGLLLVALMTGAVHAVYMLAWGLSAEERAAVANAVSKRLKVSFNE